MDCTTEPVQEWLTPKDIANALGVHRNTVARWVTTGRLSAIRTPSGRVRINVADLNRILSEPAEMPRDPVAA